MSKRNILLLIPAALINFLVSCGTPKELRTDDIPVVKDFELDRYLGKWYEIARLDHSFERGLENVTANYRLKDDGDIEVINRGYNIEDKEWSEAEGNARIPDMKKPAFIEVSFFWIFYSPYKIIKLDPDYKWSVVTSSSKEYLWILSREPEMPEGTYNELLDFARGHGFPLEKLHKVSHDPR